jgi:CBS domain containing-hemolysin-like protein
MFLPFLLAEKKTWVIIFWATLVFTYAIYICRPISYKALCIDQPYITKCYFAGILENYGIIYVLKCL